MIENKKLYFLTPVQFKQFKILWAMPLGDLHTETESLPWIRRHVPSLAYKKRKIIQDCLLAENRRRAEPNNHTDSGWEFRGGREASKGNRWKNKKLNSELTPRGWEASLPLVWKAVSPPPPRSGPDVAETDEAPETTGHADRCQTLLIRRWKCWREERWRSDSGEFAYATQKSCWNREFQPMSPV